MLNRRGYFSFIRVQMYSHTSLKDVIDEVETGTEINGEAL